MSQDCVGSWQSHCTNWFVSWIGSLELTETNHQQPVCWESAPREKLVEQDWCNTPKVSLPGLVLLLNCPIFNASSNFNPAQLVPSLRTCQDHACLAPASGNEFPAQSRAAVGAGPVLVGSAVGLQSPILVSTCKLEVRLLLQRHLRLLRSSLTRCCSCGKHGAL